MLFRLLGGKRKKGGGEWKNRGRWKLYLMRLMSLWREKWSRAGWGKVGHEMLETKMRFNWRERVFFAT